MDLHNFLEWLRSDKEKLALGKRNALQTTYFSTVVGAEQNGMLCNKTIVRLAENFNRQLW